MGDVESNGAVTVIGGGLERCYDGYGLCPQLPVTRKLGVDDIGDVDLDEDIRFRPELDGRPQSYSLGKILSTLFFAVLSILLCIWAIRTLFPPLSSESTKFGVSVCQDQLPTKVQELICQIKELEKTRRPDALLQFCGEKLDDLRDVEKGNLVWRQVWMYYLHTLYILHRSDELNNRCDELLKLDPDADVAIYYRNRNQLDDIANRVATEKLNSDERSDLKEQLLEIEKVCESRLSAISEALRGGGPKNGLRVDELKFRRLLSEAFLQQWIVEGREVSNSGLEVLTCAVRELRRGPRSIENVELELKLWTEVSKEIDQLFSHPKLRLGWSEILIDSEHVNCKSVARKIEALRNELKEAE